MGDPPRNRPLTALRASRPPPGAPATRRTPNAACAGARFSAHLLGMGALAMDCGAMTVFLYIFTEREKIYNLIEALTGQYDGGLGPAPLDKSIKC